MAAAWLKALKELSRRPPSDEELDRFVKEIIDEKLARATVLVLAAHLEQALRNFLKSRMINLSRTEEEALFERDAPLSTFSKLIRVAHAFGMIDVAFRRECDCIREIRNAFAHAPGPIDFETPEIKTACLLLTKYYDVTEEFDIDPDHPRALYMGSVMRIALLLIKARQNPQTEFPLSLND